MAEILSKSVVLDTKFQIPKKLQLELNFRGHQTIDAQDLDHALHLLSPDTDFLLSNFADTGDLLLNEIPTSVIVYLEPSMATQKRIVRLLNNGAAHVHSHESSEALGAHMNAIKRRKEMEFPNLLPTVKIGDLEIDPNTNLIKLHGEFLDVPKSSHRAIIELAKMNGNLVSREDLKKMIWGDNEKSDDIFRNTISRARSATGNKELIIYDAAKKGYRLNTNGSSENVKSRFTKNPSSTS